MTHRQRPARPAGAALLWPPAAAAGRTKRVIANMDMKAPIYTTPVAANGILHVAARKHLSALQVRGR